MEKFSVVFHINESAKWAMLLANVSNLIKDLGQENIIIKVVANGAAVVDYISNDNKDNNELLNRIRELSKLGVDFIVCKNSLVGNKINENLLPKFVTIVPAGVTELVKRQSEGYSYIRP